MRNSEYSYADSDTAADGNEIFSCNVSIVCRCILEWKSFTARILSYNRDGMYFESDVYLAEGGMIFYQIADLINWFYTSRWKNLRTVSLAKVLSCREIADSDFRFGIDVRYYRHYP